MMPKILMRSYKLKFIICVFVFTLMLLNSYVVYANDDVINEALEVYDFSEINPVLSNNIGLDISVEKIVRDILVGKIDISVKDISNYIIDSFQQQYRQIMTVFFDLFILGISSAFIQNLTNSVKPKSTSSMGNYVCYIVLIHMLATSLTEIMLISTTFLSFIEDFTTATIPILMGTLAFSGYLGTLYFVQPILVVLSYIISYLFKNILIQFIFVIGIIEIVNGITSKELLSNFCDIGNKIIKWCLRSVAIGYIGILSLVKIGAPISDNLVKKGAKAAVGAVPVVGNTLKSAVDTVSMVADATSNALTFAIVVVVIIYGLNYFISLLAYNVIFTISYVLIEPIADKNIVKAIKSLTKYIGYLMSVFAVSMFLLIFTVVIVLG